MKKIEQMQRYIERTNLSDDQSYYDVDSSGLKAIYEFSKQDFFGAACLLFAYGRAKGFRMAQKERQA